MVSIRITLSAIAVIIGCVLFIMSVGLSNGDKTSDNYKMMVASRFLFGFLGIATIFIMAIFFWTEIFELIVINNT